jgi:hypothetical protein
LVHHQDGRGLFGAAQSLKYVIYQKSQERFTPGSSVVHNSIAGMPVPSRAGPIFGAQCKNAVRSAKAPLMEGSAQFIAGV